MKEQATNDERRTTNDEQQVSSHWSLVIGRWSVRQHLPLTLILLLALALRLIVWAGPLHQLANDEIEYVTVARDLLAGRSWVFYESYPWLRAPLYNLFLAGSLWLAGDDLHWAALPNIALSLANVWLTYQLALRLVGQRAATLAALLTAVLWTNVTFASLYMAETLWTFCFLAGLVFLFKRSSVGAFERWNETQNSEFRIQNSKLKTQNSKLKTPPSPLLLISLSGFFLGLATLTRSASLLFLPIIAGWLLLQRTTNNGQQATDNGQRTRLILPLTFLIAAALTIAPWTIRNYVAYGRIIPVETGLSYNLWAFNEPRESLSQINRTLEQIPNPADRSDYATAQGIARLREDPAILLRKLWPNWVYLFRVKPIEDRFVLESYYRDVRLPQFVAALVLDDTLYLLVALAGIIGLTFERSSEKRQNTTDNRQRTTDILCILWVGYIVATMLLTHGEARYRHFLLPVLIPYAAWALSHIRRGEGEKGRRGEGEAQWWQKQRLPSLRFLVSLSPLLLVLVSFLSTYPYTWAGQNLARGWQQAMGDIAWATGDKEGALRRYQAAAEASSTADAYLRLGDLAQQVGAIDAAEAAYRKSFDLARLWVAPSASLGDLLRSQGREDEARAAFQGFYADEQQMLDWSWRHLVPAPRATLDLGGGLDFGYVDGVYAAETQQGASARWTNGRALLRLAAPAGATTLRLRLAAPHPGAANTATTVCVAARCTTFTVDRTWRSYSLSLPLNAENAPIELRSSTFDGGDGRTLGLLIDEAWIE